MRKSTRPKTGWRSPQPADFTAVNAPKSDRFASAMKLSTQFGSSFIFLAGLLVGSVIVFVVEEWRLNKYFERAVAPQVAELEVLKYQLVKERARNEELTESLRNNERVSAMNWRRQMAPVWSELREALKRWEVSVSGVDPGDPETLKSLHRASEELLHIERTSAETIDSMLGGKPKK